MRRRSWIAAFATSVLAASVLAASCGISGKTGGEDPQKSELAILDLRVAPTDSSAVVSWHTPMQTVGTLAWGLVGGSPSDPISSSPTGQHAVTIPASDSDPNLDPDTRYWYQVTAATPLGARVTSLPDTFRTLVNSDVNDSTPPVITGLEVFGITASSADVRWTTDDRTIGQVEYGLTDTYGSTVPYSTAYSRWHVVTLTGLREDEEYNLRVWAKNRATNPLRRTSHSDNLTFRTADRPWVEVYPDTVHAEGNADFEFGVRVRGAQNVAGLTFMLSYDPSVMEILSVRKTAWFDSTQGHILISELDQPSLGRAKWDATWTIVFENGTPVGTLANGGGEVAHIRARGKGTGASSPLRLVDLDLDGDGKPETRLLDHNRRDIPLHVRGGVVIKAM